MRHFSILDVETFQFFETLRHDSYFETLRHVGFLDFETFQLL